MASPPGWFSGPLLADPEFRQVFLARTKQLVETVYTDSVFGPVLDRYAEQLTPGESHCWFRSHRSPG